MGRPEERGNLEDHVRIQLIERDVDELELVLNSNSARIGRVLFMVGSGLVSIIVSLLVLLATLRFGR